VIQYLGQVEAEIAYVPAYSVGHAWGTTDHPGRWTVVVSMSSGERFQSWGLSKERAIKATEAQMKADGKIARII